MRSPSYSFQTIKHCLSNRASLKNLSCYNAACEWRKDNMRKTITPVTFIKRWRVGLLGALVSLAAVYFIISQIDVSLLADALVNARYIWLLPSIAFVVLGLMARGWRWRVLLGGELSWWRAFNILNVAYLVNGVIPFRAGEVARAYLATQAQPPIPALKSVSTIVVERLLDTLAVLAIMALALTVAPLPDELRAAAGVFAPLVVVGFIMLVMLAARRAFVLRLLTGITGRVPLFARIKLVDLAGHFLDGLAPLTNPAALVNALLWTAISWVFSLASGYVLMYAFFDTADWAVTCLFTAAASFAVAVPAVPGNLGTYELSILLALRAMGYGEPYATAAAFAVVVHGVNLGVNAILGVYGFIQEGISLNQLSHGVRGMRT